MLRSATPVAREEKRASVMTVFSGPVENGGMCGDVLRYLRLTAYSAASVFQS
jgi:hypothetical protein